ncbi:hypothetical protein BDW74DRAFT_153919 [Aspergillus multicolor]|uniref:uncharacterized protein n=1 Tax=Aspergillus multicolor TaxID=41759 RepID=UPI003CCE2642
MTSSEPAKSAREWDAPRRTHRIHSRTYAICSNTAAVLIIVSAFQSNISEHDILLRLAAAAILTLTVHSLILLYAPPEEQALSSFILCILGGGMSYYILMTLLW